MSEIITNKLTGKTAAGNVTITSEGGSATMQLQQGVAKAWVNFNASSTIVSRDSLNSSSLTDHSTGRHSNNYTNNMANVNYNHASCGGNSHSNLIAVMQHVGTNAPTTSSARYHVTYVNSNNYDAQFVGVNIFGDLA